MDKSLTGSNFRAGKRFAVAITVLLAALSVVSGSNAVAEGGYWGAVAVGPGGYTASSWNHRTPAIAARIARNRCRGRCTVVRTFRRACGAIAVALGPRLLGRQRNWVWGYGSSTSSRSRANATALHGCARRKRSATFAGRNLVGRCNIRSWACTSGVGARPARRGPTGRHCKWARSFKHGGRGCFCRRGPAVGGVWVETTNVGACWRAGR